MAHDKIQPPIFPWSLAATSLLAQSLEMAPGIGAGHTGLALKSPAIALLRSVEDASVIRPGSRAKALRNLKGCPTTDGGVFITFGSQDYGAYSPVRVRCVPKLREPEMG